jgi:hypothetical protein
MNMKMPTKYPLRHDRIVFLEIRLHSESPMLYRPALHGNALSLARRALKGKFPTPTVPLVPHRQRYLRTTFLMRVSPRSKVIRLKGYRYLHTTTLTSSPSYLIRHVSICIRCPFLYPSLRLTQKITPFIYNQLIVQKYTMFM